MLAGKVLIRLGIFLRIKDTIPFCDANGGLDGGGKSFDQDLGIFGPNGRAEIGAVKDDALNAFWVLRIVFKG